MKKLEEQLETIIKDNNIEELKKIFCNSYNINKYIDDALIYASNNSLETVKYLVELGAKNLYLGSALANASYNNSLEMVKYLIEKGANNLNNALYWASENNNLEIVKYLIEKGATDLDDALANASSNNSLETVKYLKFYIFIKNNNICTEKYKNIIFFS
jgi:ankyrin repeat protein